jgi:hypothetical protein
MKPSKYDARTSAVFANVLLLDCGKTPVPMHVVSPFADATERELKEEIVAAGGGPSWVWHTDEDMPPFPARANGHGSWRSGAPAPGEGAACAAGAERGTLDDRCADRATSERTLGESNRQSDDVR